MGYAQLVIGPAGSGKVIIVITVSNSIDVGSCCEYVGLNVYIFVYFFISLNLSRLIALVCTDIAKPCSGQYIL